MKNIDSYLEYLNVEDKSLDEQTDYFLEDGAEIAIGMTIASLIVFITGFFIMLTSLLIFKSTSKIDVKLSKKINEILKDSDWKVYVFKHDTPNAFCIISKTIFITTGLFKILTKREIESVLLHEAYHIKKFHGTKKILMKNPIIVLCLPLLLIPGVGILIFLILTTLLKIPLDITIGRKMELNADSYAVKYGYKKEIASALTKLINKYKKNIAEKNHGKLLQVIVKINEMIDEHPSLKKRITNILKKKEIYKPGLTLQKTKSLFLKK